MFLIPLHPGKTEVVWTCNRGSGCKGLTGGDTSAGAAENRIQATCGTAK